MEVAPAKKSEGNAPLGEELVDGNEGGIIKKAGSVHC